MQNELILYWPEGMSPVYSRPKVPCWWNLLETHHVGNWWTLMRNCYKPAREGSAGCFWTLCVAGTRHWRASELHRGQEHSASWPLKTSYLLCIYSSQVLEKLDYPLQDCSHGKKSFLFNIALASSPDIANHLMKMFEGLKDSSNFRDAKKGKKNDEFELRSHILVIGTAALQRMLGSIR